MTPENVEKWLAEISAAYEKPPIPKPYRLMPKYRAPLPGDMLAKMRHMRREGFTIGDIAREVRCSWNTAFRQTKGCDSVIK